MADSYDPNVVRGDTLRWTMTLKNSSGGTYNLAGSTLSMQVRSGYYPAKLLASYTVGVTAGSTLYTPEGETGGLVASGGTIVVCVGSNYTKNFPPYTNVFYDIQQKIDSSDDTITLLQGKINTDLDVTST